MVDYQKKMQQYKDRIKNAAQFISFLETLFAWVESLYAIKRIRREQEPEILSYYPREILTELDALSAEISTADYPKLKSILLRETSELINFIISVGHLRRKDFDDLQFKLSQIFGKEEITLMLEWARLHLLQVAKEQETEKSQAGKEERIAEEEYLKKIRSLPQSELNKLVVSQMFDFSPRARTPQERQEVLKTHQEKVFAQKKRFRRFEEKLLDATVEARGEAQSKVYRQIGVVKREMNLVVEEFRQKAREFASDEGPKKEMEKARGRITHQQEEFSLGIEQFRQNLAGKGAGWKEKFRRETEKAQGKIQKRTGRLQEEATHKGKNWEREFGIKIKTAQKSMAGAREELEKEQQHTQERMEREGKKELEEAEQRVKEGTAHFSADVQLASTRFSGKAAEIQERGQQEINLARTMMLKGQGEFEGEVGKARRKFSGKAAEMDYATTDFIRKRDTAREKFIRRGLEIEMGMYGNIYEGKKKFDRERAAAQERFMSRAEEIQGRATGHLTEKRDKFMAGKEKGRTKFRGKAEEIKGAGKGRSALKIKRPEFPGQQKFIRGGEQLAKGGEQLAAGAQASKSQMEQQRQKIMLSAGEGRQKMQAGVQQKRELFSYEVRFAQYNIHERARQFGEKIAAKQEEFKARGKQVTTRHRAHQKAQIIHNLLRMIREMH